jgi:hypothetical protein
MYKKYLVLSALFTASLFVTPQSSSAQFTNGKMLLGPHIGISGVGSQPAFGANFEVGITEPGKAGPGIIGISGRIDYWSWSDGEFYKYTWITVGVFANYHFGWLIESKDWDLFAGLGIGYENVSSSYSGPFASLVSYGYGSGIFISGDAGARYFFSPGFAARAQVGFGLELLALGVDFGLN